VAREPIGYRTEPVLITRRSEEEIAGTHLLNAMTAAPDSTAALGHLESWPVVSACRMLRAPGTRGTSVPRAHTALPMGDPFDMGVSGEAHRRTLHGRLSRHGR
jgi:hypothetical protein